jgi:hypothetical protein
MNLGPFLTSLPSWALFSLVVVLCILAAEAGIFIAKRRENKGIKEAEAAIGSAVAAILGLLAFMLGFTFSLTESRFGHRKELVIQEANAIGTSYLRTSLIPEKQKLEVRKLYREYVNILLQNENRTEMGNSIIRLEELHLLIWQQTASLMQEDLDPQIRALFTAAVNLVIDLFAERKTIALIFRIPDIIWSSLLLLSALGMFTFGYQAGKSGLYKFLIMTLVAAAFAVVMVMIADMDSTAGNRFKVSQQPLQDVQKMMQKDIH